MTPAQAGPSGASIIAALQSIPEGTDEERRAAAWRALSQATTADEFAVLLDYALDYGLIDSTFAPQWRGEAGDGEPTSYWVNPIDGSEMVWIPPGDFFAGQPGRRVTSEGFFLARHPVTNRQFKRFLDATQHPAAPNHPQYGTFLNHWPARVCPPHLENHPVVWVSFFEALAYCDWALLTLPTEWLWEKAARGTDGREFPWGSEHPRKNQYSPNDFDRAHVHSNETCEVGRFPAVRTPFGCEDLVGNVSEWCLLGDEADRPAHARQLVPTIERIRAAGNQAAVRGSAYMRTKVGLMHASHRRKLSALRRNDWVGFRTAFYPLRHRE
jgi:serine/threonine-protein kinase